MAFKKYNLTDRGTAELGVDINASATQITLQNVEDLPTSNFTLTLIQEVDDVFIKSEKIYVTTRTGNICTNVIRGYAGSTAKSFDAGDKAQLLIIAEHIIDIQNEVTRINTLFS